MFNKFKPVLAARLDGDHGQKANHIGNERPPRAEYYHIRLRLESHFSTPTLYKRDKDVRNHGAP